MKSTATVSTHYIDNNLKPQHTIKADLIRLSVLMDEFLERVQETLTYNNYIIS